MKLGTQKLPQPCKIWNIDGSLNKGGLLTDYIDLEVQTKNEHKIMRFLVTDLGEDIILGYPWLALFEPPITWGTATIDVSSLPIVLRTIHPYHHQERTTIARTTATELAITAGQYQRAPEIPKEYQCHAKVFSEEEAQRFPPSQPWDHAIVLKPDAPDTINCKVYPLDRKSVV